MEPQRRHVEIAPPYDFKRTVSRQSLWGGGPCARWVQGALWRATWTPQGPAATGYRRTDSGVEVQSFGPGASWAIDTAPELLGAHDDPSSFQPSHPLLKDLHARSMGLRFGKTQLMLDRLLPVIIGQKVTAVGAKGSWKDLVWEYGEPAPGPIEHLRLPPHPEVLADVPAFRLVACNIEGKRAAVLKEACRRHRRLEEAASMTSAQALQRLQALRGIGVWTATLTVSVTHGDPDIPWIGDYHLPNAVSWHLAQEPRGDDERMLELLEPFAPHRGRALFLLKMAGRAPRYGPKTDVRNIRGD